MLDKRLAATIAAIAIVASMAVVAALLPGQEESLPIQETVSGVPVQRSSVPPAQEQWMYILREHNGYVAVFEKDSDAPVMVLEKKVKHLPEYDRIQMQDGIKIFSEEELSARIEDYIS